MDYQGTAVPAPTLDLQEVEPNARRTNAQGLLFGTPIRMNGTISSTDDLGENDFLSFGLPIEDLFWIRLQTVSNLTVDLAAVNAGSDLNLLVVVFDSSPNPPRCWLQHQPRRDGAGHPDEPRPWPVPDRGGFALRPGDGLYVGPNPWKLNAERRGKGGNGEGAS